MHRISIIQKEFRWRTYKFLSFVFPSPVWNGQFFIVHHFLQCFSSPLESWAEFIGLLRPGELFRMEEEEVSPFKQRSQNAVLGQVRLFLHLIQNCLRHNMVSGVISKSFPTPANWRCWEFNLEPLVHKACALSLSYDHFPNVCAGSPMHRDPVCAVLPSKLGVSCVCAHTCIIGSRV